MSAERLTAYKLAKLIHRDHGVPVFPVKLFKDPSGKWQKMPLCKWSQGDGHPDDLYWRRANAVGVPMGRRSGLLAIDLDTYKKGSMAAEWVNRRNLPVCHPHPSNSLRWPASDLQDP